MAADSAEGLSSESIQQQIMASEQVSAAEVLQNTMSASIPTTIQTIPRQAGVITTISASALPETMTTSETMIATQSISIDTQGASATLSGQEMSESIPQVQQHESVVVSVTGTQDSVVISSENVAISASTSLDASQQIANLSSAVQANNPWAARLHDCELIGDSYRGYVTTEVELDLILTLHKQHTNSCWGTRQSPSSAKPSIRLMWKSQYVPYDGIPFLNTGRRATVMECQYGPRRKGSVNKKQVDYDEHGHPVKRHRPTCPARIYIKKVRKFPEFRIDPNLEGKNIRQAQERALTALRLVGVHVGGEERYYVQLPLPLAHEYHDVDDIPMDPDEGDSQGQRLNPEVMHKIRELVARGVTGIYTVKHCLKEYVEKELFVNLEPPPRHNKSYFPTIIDIQNHIHQAQMALATGALLPLPPLTNLPPSSPQLKEKTRKRKHPTEKLSQSSQTAEALASMQQQYQSARPSMLSNQEQEQLIQQSGRENFQGSETQQLEIIQGSEGETAEVDISSQPQILITQGSGTGRDEGQVVIVVNASSFFSGQSDSETPTTLSLTIPASQVASLSHASLHSAAGSQAVAFIPQANTTAQTQGSAATPQTVAFIPQALDSSRGAVAFLTSQQTDSINQVPVSAAYLAAHGQSVPGQVMTAQAAVEAVLSAATSREDTKQANCEEESVEGEPQTKRQALGMDFTSLVKEVVFDDQQADGQVESERTSEQSPVVNAPTSTTVQAAGNTQLNSLSQTDVSENFLTMETRSMDMVTESVLQSLPGGQGVVRDYSENSDSLLGNQEEKLVAQSAQSFTAPVQITGTPQQTNAQFATDICRVSQTESAPLETAQGVCTPMEVASDETKQLTVEDDNSLITTGEEHGIQDYSMQTPSTESTSNSEHMNMPLVFESDQQLTENTAAVASHSSAVPTLNNPEVFT
ncbi:calcium-responsive transcription factor isoform X2 [Pocillopora verrucosa]|uniref:calcium-responsive transcription factor isoform X2 n=1 Tax=Pocillopora verrucosa TaxID=203993 RepID=UPI00333F3EC7